MNTSIHYSHQLVNILAFDTSMEEASLALWTKGKMRSIPINLGRRMNDQASCLLPLMQEVLKESGLTFQDLDLIATPVGPGSFTGIRLGLATAQGLLLATQAKAFTPTTFDIFAFEAWQKKLALNHNPQPLLITLTTKRGSFYTQGFDEALVPLFLGKVCTEEEIQDLLKKYANMWRVETSTSSTAETLVYLYFDRLKKGQALPHTLCPYYVHHPEFIKQEPCSL